MNKIRQNFHQRYKNKIPFRHQGMGDGQVVIFVDQFVKVNDVNIHGPIAPMHFPTPA